MGSAERGAMCALLDRLRALELVDEHTFEAAGRRLQAMADFPEVFRYFACSRGKEAAEDGYTQGP